MYQLLNANGPIIDLTTGATFTIDAAPPEYAAWIALGNQPSAPAVQALTDAQAIQVDGLRMVCTAMILGGYTSSALGQPHTYPNGTTDQINMMGSVTASLLPGLPGGWVTPFWCADASGNWGWQAHTAAQIQQAGSDGKTWVVTCQTKLAQLTVQVMGAQTVAEVLAIVWA